MEEISERRMVRHILTSAIAALAIGFALSGAPAQAQDLGGPAPVPPADIPNPGTAAAPPPSAVPQSTDLLPAPQLPGGATPYAPDTELPRIDLKPITAEKPKGRLLLAAKLTDDGPQIKAGVVWRVFGNDPGPNGSRPMVAEAKGGAATFELPSGTYLVYCGFGYTGNTTRVELKDGIANQTVVLNAGGVRFNAVTGPNKTISADDLTFNVYSPEVDSRGEPKPAALDVSPGEIVRLAAGSYNVVANYGDANANTSAEIEVKAGKLSDVTLTEKAAKVTLKLVGSEGGEAIADTKWSVLTQAGDIVTSGVGAFPSFVLAEGDYTIVARHEDTLFQRVVTIASGDDKEIEVLAKGGEKVRQ
ncbi:hypothetical protein [Oryzibacter oryziterrae]|uniref:hypothetical protein n=1 Tax=Oryzibacter oryziterrae TaxID=2766474 RepID=UPI001F48878A|nr:hypothetical protein [Oryzibacter oryziterrae]